MGCYNGSNNDIGSVIDADDDDDDDTYQTKLQSIVLHIVQRLLEKLNY